MLCLRITCPTGSKYVENRGSRMEPWGTPLVGGATEDQASPTTTEKVLFDKYD